jgi:hypoxia up-regulated 1
MRLLSLLGFLYVLPLAVQSVVVGIDFGSEFVKVSLVRPGAPFHIVLDETSKRKIPALVAFDTHERAFGSSATGLVVKRADVSYMYVQRLLGKTLNSPEVKEIQERGYPYKFVEIPGRDGAVGFQHNDETIYSPEELLAMNFEQIKRLCEDDAEGRPVHDAVITVPGYWTQHEREAMITAAELGGFHVLSLLNQNTAAAIQYGIDRKYNETDPPFNVLIYNMGASATEVTLVEYSSYQTKAKKKNSTVGQFEVKGFAADTTLGGAAFDARLVKFMAQEWHKQYPRDDIQGNLRAMAKLRKQAGDIKKVLSANKETPIFIQSLLGDNDFKHSITREKFLDISRDLLERVTGPLAKVLAEAGLSKSDIGAIAVVGGGLRIPAVRHRLEEFMGMELTHSLDGDEAMSQGAVFRAANLSTAFQVRKLGMTDVTAYPVGFHLSGPDSSPLEVAGDDSTEAGKKLSKRANLFKRFHKLAKRKTVTFTNAEDFMCALSHEQPELLPEGVSVPICTYNVTFGETLKTEKILTLLQDQKPKVALSFSLSSSGVASLFKAEATLEEMVQIAVPKPSPNATAKANSSSDPPTPEGEQKAEGEPKTEEEPKQAEPKEAAEDDSEQAEKTPEEGEEPAASSASSASVEGVEASTNATADTNETVEYKMHKKVHRLNLKFTTIYPPGFIPMNHSSMSAATKRLKELRQKDLQQIRVAEAKNKIESSIYELRGLLDEQNIQTVSTEEQRGALQDALAASEEWLLGPDVNDYEKLDAKNKEIQALSAPILFRARELVERPQAVNKTLHLCNYTRDMVKSFAQERPWIPEEDKTSLLSMVDRLEEWLQNKTDDQNALALHEAPAFTSEELMAELRPIAKFSQQLLRRVKPKEEVKKEKVKRKGNATANGTSPNEATPPTAETPTEAPTEEAKKDEADRDL